MYKRVLFAVDLEGVNCVVGEAYMGLHRDSDEWNVARHQAALEINAASEALFVLGVEKIGVWDNHGGGNNIDASSLDPRLELIAHTPPRMSFIDGEYDCICYLCRWNC